MSSYRTTAAALGVALALALTTTAVAVAKPLVQERYEGSDAGAFDDCGATYEWQGSWSGKFTIKPGRGGDPTPYLSDNYRWDWLIRNPANGAWFTEHGQALYKDVKITHLHDTVYRFIAQESGSPYTIKTSDGRKIVKDRGLLRYQFDVDTKGDDDLENDEFIDDSFVLVADHGAHPVWHMTSDEYCDIVNDLVG